MNKLIKTEADYKLALKRVDDIFDAKPGTPEGDELELLVILIELYENEHFPMDLPDPVTAIKFRMEQQNLKQKDLVPYLGSESKVSEVLSGKRALSLTMIRKLVNGLGIPAEVLLQEPGAELPSEDLVKATSHFPIAEMAKRGWFEGFCGTAREARNQWEDLVAAFVAPFSCADLQPVYNRQKIHSGKQCDEHALLAWQIRVVTLAQKETVAEYIPGTVDMDFLRKLAALSSLSKGPKLAKEFLARAGIPLVFERHLDKTYLDGAAIPMPSGRPMVALTLRHDRLDNFWFTLFHELAHIALHLDKDGQDAYFDDTTAPGSTNKREKDADEMATEALIPSTVWKDARLTIRSREESVRLFAARQHISPAIPAGRLRRRASNYSKFSRLVGNRQVRKFFETPTE